MKVGSEHSSQPTYFRGKQQSEEFARGAWAARDFLAKLEGESECGFVQEVTFALADKAYDNVATPGEYARGFMAALVEFLAFYEIVGSPNLDGWRPLRMQLRYDENGAHPIPGSSLYDLNGTPVAIAPDETVYQWSDGGVYEEDDAGFVSDVVREGKRVSEADFEVLIDAAEDRFKARANTRSVNG
jgi:hypothetical protein